MSLRCLLGLTACLNTQGVAIPGDEVIQLLDSCQIARRYSVTQFERADDQGNLHIEFLLNQGLPGYIPADTAPQRRANVLRACEKLLKDFNDERKWTR